MVFLVAVIVSDIKNAPILACLLFSVSSIGLESKGTVFLSLLLSLVYFLFFVFFTFSEASFPCSA